MRDRIVGFLIVVALPFSATADGLPPLAVAPLDSVEVVSFGPLDLGWLAAEDAAREDSGLPPRFAIPRPVHLTDRLTLGQASRLAEMDRLRFQQLLASRDIPVHYEIEDFEADLATLRGLARS